MNDPMPDGFDATHFRASLALPVRHPVCENLFMGLTGKFLVSLCATGPSFGIGYGVPNRGRSTVEGEDTHASLPA
jgi:hypothetical protein